ncbi:MAG: transposase [Rhizomicrobium sp.]
MLHKFREGTAAEFKGLKIGSEGKVAEVDGAYFGGYVKPANLKESRRDRRVAINQSGKRQSLIVIREGNGETLPAVFRSEGAALGWIKSRVMDGTLVNADEAGSWDGLYSRYEMKRLNHEEAYSLDGACTDQAESYFSRIRRAEMSHHHRISGPYLLRYAQESAWREDQRRVDNEWLTGAPRDAIGAVQQAFGGFQRVLPAASEGRMNHWRCK